MAVVNLRAALNTEGKNYVIEKLKKANRIGQYTFKILDVNKYESELLQKKIVVFKKNELPLSYIAYNIACNVGIIEYTIV